MKYRELIDAQAQHRFQQPVFGIEGMGEEEVLASYPELRIQQLLDIARCVVDAASILMDDNKPSTSYNQRIAVAKVGDDLKRVADELMEAATA